MKVKTVYFTVHLETAAFRKTHFNNKTGHVQNVKGS